MSHFAFHTEPSPVPTRHGDIYVGTGESTTGVVSIAIVTPGDDHDDLHLSVDQARRLIEELSECVAALTCPVFIDHSTPDCRCGVARTVSPTVIAQPDVAEEAASGTKLQEAL